MGDGGWQTARKEAKSNLSWDFLSLKLLSNSGRKLLLYTKVECQAAEVKQVKKY